MPNELSVVLVLARSDGAIKLARCTGIRYRVQYCYSSFDCDMKFIIHLPDLADYYL